MLVSVSFSNVYYISLLLTAIILPLLLSIVIVLIFIIIQVCRGVANLSYQDDSMKMQLITLKYKIRLQ